MSGQVTVPRFIIYQFFKLKKTVVVVCCPLTFYYIWQINFMTLLLNIVL